MKLSLRLAWVKTALIICQDRVHMSQKYGLLLHPDLDGIRSAALQWEGEETKRNLDPLSCKTKSSFGVYYQGKALCM